MENQNNQAFWKAQYDSVCELFDNGDDDQLEILCRRMLESEHLPLAYRLHCQYMFAYVSSDPAGELQKALEIDEILKGMIESGAISDSTWLKNCRKEINDALAEVQAAESEETPAVARSSQVPTLTIDTATVSSEPLTFASQREQDRAYSPIIHPSVRQAENDAEMLLQPPEEDEMLLQPPPGPATGITPTVATFNISNIHHPLTIPLSGEDARIRKRARGDNDHEDSEDEDDDDVKEYRGRTSRKSKSRRTGEE